MRILTIDIGGQHVKLAFSGEKEPRRFASGAEMTPRMMVAGLRKVAPDWKYEAISMGYPGPVLRGKPVAEPHNLGTGWVGFDFQNVLGCPVKVVNDAALQALGSYNGGKLLFLGLGTGLGSAMIVDGVLQPMELGHLPYKKRTYEDYVGQRGLERYGKKKWRKYVADVVERLIGALEPEDVVIGGGNVLKLKAMPEHCRAGKNENAFIGGERLWEDTPHARSAAPEPRVMKRKTK